MTLDLAEVTWTAAGGGLPSETNKAARSFLAQLAWDRWNSPAAKRAQLLERAKAAREKKPRRKPISGD